MARRRQAVTIKHVAKDAGVSLQTVSRVINNEPNVRLAMKERVQNSIDRLGYVPSIAAQRMSGSRSYLILAINDREKTIAEWHSRSGTDWVDQMLLGGILTCSQYGYRMMVELVDTHNDHVERELSATIAALQPDGVILTPPHSENRLITGLLAKKNIPFARIGSVEPGPGIRLTMDDERSARMATEMLIGLGHRRVGFVAGPDDYSLSTWRINGWKAAMEQAGLPTSGLLQHGDFRFDSGLAATQSLLALASPPTAIIASNDQMALGTIEAAREKNLDVPSDLSIISFDNTPVVRFTDPPLTAVDQPVAATISKAVELLINVAKLPLPREPINIEATLVERASTVPPQN
ncbi:MAG: LacI family DNA-binding transcriptional regulator [Alphaproteobacteria bacterium]|nr:MAG: LacI family DNA-binding transcriptional regulator [Alphaproteobacteria bacterium]